MDKEAVSSTLDQSLFKAIHELKIDVPVMRYEIVGAGSPNHSVILYLYGGEVVTWRPELETSEGKSDGKPKSKRKAKSLKMGTS